MPRRKAALAPLLAQARAAAMLGEPMPSAEALVQRAAQGGGLPRRRQVINATGVLLHTNLGRAPLAPEALGAIAELASGSLDLELDLASGARGSRHAVAEAWLQQLLGVEAALVVNNGAAAVLLAATALGHGREVVCARGELVAIGGGFRVHEVLAAAGAKLVEVGATNRSTVADFRQACGPQTAMLWRTHRANFAMSGFVEDAPRSEVAALAHELGLWAVEDLGHGLLAAPPGPLGLAEGPVQESLAAGMDLVIFSADKLLGGPQAGLVVGKAAAMAQLAKHPLMRALRPDKLSLVALEATLALWAQPEEAWRRLPVWRLALRPPEALQAWGQHLLVQAQAACPGLPLRLLPSEGALGGGTTPQLRRPSWALACRLPSGGPEPMAEALRRGQPAVLGRLLGAELALDLFAVPPEEGAALVDALARAWGAWA